MPNVIKNNLPPSSRSFHYFEKSVNDKLDSIVRYIDKNRGSSNEKLLERINNLEERQGILEKQLYYYSEVLIRGDEKTSFDARLKMFHKLPNATGMMRISQLATVKLMSKLDEILTKHKIEYWFGYGSLLGAIVRNGPLPWDDDIDICMCRENLEKLQKILKDNDEFQITVIYDWYVKCIQYRFCSRDVKVPVFIDIGVWDYGTKCTRGKEEKVQELRAELMKTLDEVKLPYWEEKGIMPQPGSGFMRQINDDESAESWDGYDMEKVEKETTIIQEIFNQYIERGKKEGIFTTRQKAESYIYSFDNLTIKNRRMVYEKEMISPTKRFDYDGVKVCCPNDSKSFLDTCYSVWPYLPNDASILGSSHSNGKTLQQLGVQEALYKFIGISPIK